MAELMKTRPSRVRTIPIDLPGGRTGEATDLNDVVRQVIWDMKEQFDWNWSETARHLGIEIQTLNDFMEEQPEGEDEAEEPAPTTKGKKRRRPKGISLYTLSKIVGARAHDNPILLFQRHQRYRGKSTLTQSRTEIADAAAYDALCTLLTRTQAEHLTEIVDVLLGKKGLEDFLRTMRTVTGAASKKRSRR